MKVKSSIRKRPTLRNTFKNKWQLLAMLFVPLVWYIVFCYIPMYGIQLAFRNYNPRLGYLASPFVGLRYFKQFFSSFYASRVIWNTISISLYAIVFGFPVPIFLALLIDQIRRKRYQKLLQQVTYLPHFISIVVLAGMLYLFLSPQYGAVNKLLNFFGINSIGFLESHKYFKGVFVASGIWQNSGWDSIIYTAALSGIDPALYEAAEIDGAGRIRRILHISIPGLIPTIATLLILRIGQVMSLGFEKAYLLQNDLNIQASEIISTLVYKQGILQGNIGYATAVGLFNSVINLCLLLLANHLSKKALDVGLW